MNFIKTKTIVSSTKHPDQWFGCQYNMNIYRGCSHGCIYCDSRSDCYHLDHFDTVVAKENALAIIDSELKSKRKTGIIGTGAMSDPYNPFEKEHQLTRGALKIIARNGFGVHIITKSHLVTRDVDVLQEIQKYASASVGLTITAGKDALSKIIEPGAPPSSERFAAIKVLADHNIYVGVLLMPVLPFINDDEENILSIVQQASENGARFIFPMFGVTLRAGNREYFYEKLASSFPGVRKRYVEAFGEEYGCMSEKNKRLSSVFKNGCERLGIQYKMSAIIKGIHKSVHTEPATLF